MALTAPRAAGLLAVALYGCGREPEFDHVEVGLSLSGSPVIDGKLAGASIPIAVTTQVAPLEQACQGTLTATSVSGQVATVLEAGTGVGASHEAAWDGRDDAGLAFDPGEVLLRWSVLCDSGARSYADATAWAVRFGIEVVDLTSDDAGGNVTLAYHKLGLAERGITVIDASIPEYRATGLSPIDADDGSPRAPIAPWRDPDSPPWGAGEPTEHNLPAAYVAGSRARLEVTIAGTAVSQVSHGPLPALPEGLPPVRVIGSGLDPVELGSLPPSRTLRHDSAPLPDHMGRHELTVDWHLESLVDDAWVPMPGTVTTTHALYLVAGDPEIRDGSELGMAPPFPWVGVLEDTADALQDVPAEPGPVLDALRDYLHHNRWVIYNPNDAAYSGYVGPYIYWSYAWSDLSDWLDRGTGIDLYCHSMSCLLSVLANSLGVFAEQIVIGVNFTTNQTRAAGTENWRRWGFNSHSVVTPDGGLTIWDAAVDLDGDDDPANPPIDPVSPMGMDGAEYLWRLSYNDIGIVNQGRCYIR